MLTWRKRPKKQPWPLMGGERLTWKTADGLYAVDHFTAGSRAYIAVLNYGMGRQKILGVRRTLQAAQRVCQQSER